MDTYDEYDSQLGSFANWSTDSPDYTVAYGKITCWRLMYFVHVIFAYLVVFAGLAALITRLHPVLVPAHVWAGRLYVVFMLWCCATSLVIHNTGLPAAVLLSFIWCLGGLTVGWFMIVAYRDCMTKQATARVQQKLVTGALTLAKPDGTSKTPTLATLIQKEKGEIAAEKSCCRRTFSMKAVHGALMFMSWMNLAGRIMASDQSGDFTCHTQPYYKATVSSREHVATGVPEQVDPANPNYDALPWAKTGLIGWGVYLSVGPFLFAMAFGAIWAGFSAARAKWKKSVTYSTNLTEEC